MIKYIVQGGTKLSGSVTISGAKNAAVAILPATLLVSGPCRIENVPDISDVRLLLEILRDMGAEIRRYGRNTLEIDCTRARNATAPIELVRRIRASYYLIGAELGRFGHAHVAMPGGCNFGVRPIDQHVKGFSALGAGVTTEGGYINAAVAALVIVLIIGKRKGFGTQPFRPHNVPFVMLGAFLLWFGWFGFNAGGAYAADGLAAYAFTNTTIAGSIAMIVWMLYDWHYDRKPSFSGVLVGAVAGLATITPCAGYVEPWAAIIIGAVGSSVCYYAKYVQERLGFDDALEVWRAHGMGGVTGALLLGILASSNIDKVNASIHQFLMQLLGVIIVAVYSFVVTIIIFKVISAWGPIRVTKEEEEAGLDESLHGEEAYKM